MKLTGNQPSGRTRAGRRIKDIVAAVNQSSVSLSTDQFFRTGVGGTVTIPKAGKGGGGSGGLTWLA